MDIEKGVPQDTKLSDAINLIRENQTGYGIDLRSMFSTLSETDYLKLERNAIAAIVIDDIYYNYFVPKLNTVSSNSANNGVILHHSYVDPENNIISKSVIESKFEDLNYEYVDPNFIDQYDLRDIVYVRGSNNKYNRLFKNVSTNNYVFSPNYKELSSDEVVSEFFESIFADCVDTYLKEELINKLPLVQRFGEILKNTQSNMDILIDTFDLAMESPDYFEEDFEIYLKRIVRDNVLVGIFGEEVDLRDRTLREELGTSSRIFAETVFSRNFIVRDLNIQLEKLTPSDNYQKFSTDLRSILSQFELDLDDVQIEAIFNSYSNNFNWLRSIISNDSNEIENIKTFIESNSTYFENAASDILSRRSSLNRIIKSGNSSFLNSTKGIYSTGRELLKRKKLLSDEKLKQKFVEDLKTKNETLVDDFIEEYLLIFQAESIKPEQLDFSYDPEKHRQAQIISSQLLLQEVDSSESELITYVESAYHVLATFAKQDLFQFINNEKILTNASEYIGEGFFGTRMFREFKKMIVDSKRIHKFKKSRSIRTFCPALPTGVIRDQFNKFNETVSLVERSFANKH